MPFNQLSQPQIFEVTPKPINETNLELQNGLMVPEQLQVEPVHTTNSFLAPMNAVLVQPSLFKQLTIYDPNEPQSMPIHTLTDKATLQRKSFRMM